MQNWHARIKFCSNRTRFSNASTPHVMNRGLTKLPWLFGRCFAMASHGIKRNSIWVLIRGERTYIASYVPGPKYGFSIDWNAVGEGEEKSKLTCVTPNCVQKHVRMQKPKLSRSTTSLNPPRADFAYFASLLDLLPSWFSSCFSSSLSSFLPFWSSSPHTFLPSIIHFICSFIHFLPSLNPAFPSFSWFPFVVFLYFILFSWLMLACFLHFWSLAYFTFARLLPLLWLAHIG